MKRPIPDGKIRIVPSLLGADFGDLRREAARLVSAGAQWISLDVMDGHFVPNLSFGPAFIPALRNGLETFLDAHLMVEDPATYGPIFAKSGADWVVFHVEACRRPRPLLRSLRRLGVGVGLAIKPATPAKAILPYLEDMDLALVMTVEPGFGGQRFLSDMLPKVRELRNAIDRKGLKVWLQVDGGIQPASVSLAAAAGADSLVAGSAIFQAKNPVSALRALESAARKAFNANFKRRGKH